MDMPDPPSIIPARVLVIQQLDLKRLLHLSSGAGQPDTPSRGVRFHCLQAKPLKRADHSLDVGLGRAEFLGELFVRHGCCRTSLQVRQRFLASQLEEYFKGGVRVNGPESSCTRQRYAIASRNRRMGS